MTEHTTLLVGTTKGLFVLTSDSARTNWDITGPYCDGWSVNHTHGDGSVWLAGGGDEWNGAGIWRSQDCGASWELSKLADGMVDEWIRSDPETATMLGAQASDPAPFSGQLQSIWSLGRVGQSIFAGGKPAALYQSKDNGKNWALVPSLGEHPSADSWQPGAAGLTLHTIVAAPDDPKRFWLGISAAGVFATEDGGHSWTRRNRLSNAQICEGPHHPAAPKDGDTGHCVHNMVRAPGAVDVLYQQNHHGVFRSRDGGRSWDDITAGLPSTFGFPIAVNPYDPHMIWTLPLNGDSAGRFPPDASAAVWRSRDAGDTWEACRTGLPQRNCFFTVLRQAMSVDTHTSPGVYFGTNSGTIFGSFDTGEQWNEIATHLPTVLCVQAVT